ncbi:MAG: DUF933 domain-containing protein, partial [Miltoncostaeaceae bacterium]
PEEAVDPLADAEAVDLELIVADREQVERRLDRVRKGARAGEAGAKEELAGLEAVVAALDEGIPARLVADEEGRTLAQALGLLSAKPVLYVVNTDEELEPPADVAAHAAALGARCLALPVGLELELSQMDPDEAAELAQDMGLGTVRGADAVVAGAYELLDLVTFFTGSGPPEARAWAITRGTNAQRAAGKIHSDLERGFIRAEVINWEDLVASGSYSKAKETALVRMEGKEYIVQEGDVLQIRFNV